MILFAALLSRAVPPKDRWDQIAIPFASIFLLAGFAGVVLGITKLITGTRGI